VPLNYAKEKLRLTTLIEKEQAEGSLERIAEYDRQLKDINEKEKEVEKRENEKKLNWT